MSKFLIVTAVIVTTGVGLVGASIASAADSSSSDAAEMQALADAKLSATDAIAAAQAKQAGKVSELQFNLEKTVPNYEISILATDGTEHDFAVNATSGEVSVIAANEDKDQADDGEDGEQDDDNN